MVSGITKNLIWDILTNTDDVDTNGKLKPRTSYKKDYIRGASQILSAIKDGIFIRCEPSDNDKKSDSEKIEPITVSVKEYGEKYKDWKILGEFHSDSEILFSKKMKDALKYYYNDREELPAFANESVIDELESLISDK